MKFLTHYFQTKLAQAGYPADLQIEWSLSYCQGDGVAFYGDIDSNSLTALFMRCLTEQGVDEHERQLGLEKWETIWLPELATGWDSFPAITRNHFGYRYSHLNTMDLTYADVESLTLFNDADYLQSFMQEHNLTEEKIDVFGNMLQAFLDWLEDDIRSQSKALERVGYQIIELGTVSEREVVYTRNSHNYRVEVEVSPVHFYLAHAPFICTNEEEVESYVNTILQGYQHIDVSATVYDRYNGKVLGSSLLCEVEVSRADKTLGGYRRELTAEAIRNVRTNIQRHAALIRH
ncbi:hypothetical protein [Pasteurella testudinis]|uniref:hypothetical protein n=1 Tax=Pasteurella testudinis TaxID=761 RepID=UPI004057D7D6